MKFSTVLLLILVFVIIAVFLWGYFTSQLPAPLPAWHRVSAENRPSQSAAVIQSPKAQANHLFTYGDVSYLISRVDRTEELKYANTSFMTSGSFVVLSISVTNQGVEPVFLQPSDFALYDSQGQQFAIHEEGTKLAATIYQKIDLFGEALQPGLGSDGILVFEVPKAAAGFFLRLSKGYLDADLGF